MAAVAGEEKTQTATSSNFHLPVELLLEVFAKLPPKSVLRFKSVSKLWLSLITDPQFIETFQNHSHTREGGVKIVAAPCHPPLRYSRDGRDGCFLMIDFTKPPQSRATVHGPQSLPCTINKVTNMVNGILCFYNSKNPMDDIYLYNFSTREILTLAPSGAKQKGDIRRRPPSRRYYLAFSPASKEYKVLQFQSTYEVFTLGASSWREINIPVLNNSSFPDMEFCVDGFLYGTSRKILKRYDYEPRIFELDVEQETSICIKCPQFKNMPDAKLALIRGQVSLVHVKVLGSIEIKIRIWRLVKEESIDIMNVPMWSYEKRITSSFGVNLKGLYCNKLGQICCITANESSAKLSKSVMKIYDIGTGKLTNLKINNPEGIFFELKFEPQKVLDNIIPFKAFEEKKCFV